MKIKFTEKKKNPLMKRQELDGIIEHDGMPTPSRASIQKYVSKEEGVDRKHIDIRKIFSSSGRRKARLMVYIWDKKEVPVLEEKVPEEPAEEKPKEEVKEVETKPEETKEPEKKEEPKAEEKPKEEKPEEKEKKPSKEEPKKEENSE